MIEATGGMLTIIVTVEVSGPSAQLAEEFIMHDIWSPLFNELFEYVEEFVPTFTPFSCHWYVGEVPPFTAVALKVTFVPPHAVWL